MGGDTPIREETKVTFKISVDCHVINVKGLYFQEGCYNRIYRNKEVGDICAIGLFQLLSLKNEELGIFSLIQY